MIKVAQREGEDAESLLRRFKKQVRSSGVLEECRGREFFLKNSLKRKRKSKLARMKHRRK